MLTYETLVCIDGEATCDMLKVPYRLDIQNPHVLVINPCIVQQCFGDNISVYWVTN